MLRTTTVERITRQPQLQSVLHSGDRLDQATFHRLYLQTPEHFKAELIGGVVYVASPVSKNHGKPHARLAVWLGLYEEATPGAEVNDNVTNILDDKSEPQPDLSLSLLPEAGGQATADAEGYIHGAPELVIEVAYSTAAIDLHEKKQVYYAAGVKEYIVVLAASRTVRIFQCTALHYLEKNPDANGVWKSKCFPGLWLDVAAVFAPSISPLLNSVRKGIASPEHRKFQARLQRRIRRGKINNETE